MPHAFTRVACPPALANASSHSHSPKNRIPCLILAAIGDESVRAAMYDGFHCVHCGSKDPAPWIKERKGKKEPYALKLSEQAASFLASELLVPVEKLGQPPVRQVVDGARRSDHNKAARVAIDWAIRNLRARRLQPEMQPEMLHDGSFASGRDRPPRDPPLVPPRAPIPTPLVSVHFLPSAPAPFRPRPPPPPCAQKSTGPSKMAHQGRPRGLRRKCFLLNGGSRGEYDRRPSAAEWRRVPIGDAISVVESPAWHGRFLPRAMDCARFKHALPCLRLWVNVRRNSLRSLSVVACRPHEMAADAGWAIWCLLFEGI